MNACCLICGSSIEIKPIGRPRKYCSSTCRSKIRPQLEYTCLNCSKTFTNRKRNRGVKYCSYECSVMAQTFTEDLMAKHICKVCNKLFFRLPGDSNPNMYCSKRCQLISVSRRSSYYTEDVLAALLDKQPIEFLRQYSYGSYFSDFYIPKFNLLLELDGYTWHSSKEAVERDCIKALKANTLGYNMIRIWCSRKQDVARLEKSITFLTGDDLAAFIAAIPTRMINSVNLLKGVAKAANGENYITSNAVPSIDRNIFEGVETKVESKGTNA